MKNFGLSITSLLFAIAMHAQVAGPLGGNTFSNAPLAGSTQTWVNTGNVAASDNVYSTFGNLTGVGDHTDYLVVTNFGFSIPPGSTINGIVVEVERSDPNFRTADYSIRILKAGVIGATDRSSGAAYLSESYQTYGTAGDFWGETWTADDINDPGFGVAIAAQRSVGGAGATAGRIDHVRITVFYDFIITPVKLLSFTASKKDNVVELKWKTAEEVNMDRYEIERSSNGKDFEKIGEVNSGNQQLQVDYLYNDNKPMGGISYYRLKMVGVAGDIKYSRVVAIQFRSGNKVSLYPNPYREGQNLNISNPSFQPLIVTFYDPSGQQVSVIRTTTNSLSTQSLQTQHGILVYKVLFENGELAGTGKLLVE